MHKGYLRRKKHFPYLYVNNFKNLLNQKKEKKKRRKENKFFLTKIEMNYAY